MKITPQDVKTFQRIYRIKTGQSMKKEAAYRELQKLVLQMQLIYKEINVDEIKNLNIEINEHEKYVKPPKYI